MAYNIFNNIWNLAPAFTPYLSSTMDQSARREILELKFSTLLSQYDNSYVWNEVVVINVIGVNIDKIMVDKWLLI